MSGWAERIPPPLAPKRKPNIPINSDGYQNWSVHQFQRLSKLERVSCLGEMFRSGSAHLSMDEGLSEMLPGVLECYKKDMNACIRPEPDVENKTCCQSCFCWPMTGSPF